MDDLPLGGVRVIEFSWVIAGPLATEYLAMMGAEVIRVESQKRAEFRQRSGQFGLLNHNKRSCSLDLSQPRAQEIARALVQRSDVVVENFGTGVMDRLGLGYDALRRERPDLVMLSCSGLGRTGPDRDKLAFGTLLQLYSGWSLLQGQPGSDDVRVGGAWGDPLAAAMGAFAVLAALYHRQQTGEGQYIDLSLAEAPLCGIPEALMDYAMNRRVPPRLGNRDEIMAPHGCYPCRGDDEWIAIVVRDEADWAALRRMMGDPPWAQDERFADAFRRCQYQDDLDRHIAAWTAGHTAGELTAALQAAGVPAGPSLDAAGLVEDPHLRARGVFVELASPAGGTHVAVRPPWCMGPDRPPDFTPAPRLGQDNDYVFRTLLGMSDAEMAHLVESGVAF